MPGGPAPCARWGARDEGLVKARLPERLAPSELRMRPMRVEDLPEVLTIERASFGLPWAERTFRGLLGRSNTALIVAETRRNAPSASAMSPSVSPAPGVLDRKLVGYAVVWVAGSEAELGDLAVREEARCRGIGTALLEAALVASARMGAEQMFLEVRRSNISARRLYERAGFAVVGWRRGYYSRPVEDAAVMRRSLRAPSRGPAVAPEPAG